MVKVEEKESRERGGLVQSKKQKGSHKARGKPEGLQILPLCREWAAEIQDDGLFNLGGQQVEMVVPGVKNQVGGYRYLHV